MTRNLPKRHYNHTLIRASLGKVIGMVLRGFIAAPLFSRFPVFIGARTRITGRRYLHLGKAVKIEDYVEIQCVSLHGVTLGDYCSIGRGTQILPSGYYSGELGAGFIMGRNSSIGPNSYVGASGLIRIGNNVITGPDVKLLAQNHIVSSVKQPIREQGVTQRGITIEDDCWVGAGAIILDGVTVGHGTVVAAGAVVTRDVPPLSIVGGVPAALIRVRGEE